MSLYDPSRRLNNILCYDRKTDSSLTQLQEANMLTAANLCRSVQKKKHTLRGVKQLYKEGEVCGEPKLAKSEINKLPINESICHHMHQSYIRKQM